MKTRITLLGPLAAITLGGLLLCAPVATQAGGLHGLKGGKNSSANDHTKALATELQLTEQQKQQLRPILQEAAQKLRTLRANTNLSKLQKRLQLSQIRQEARTRIKAILTPEQLEKWEKLSGALGGAHRPGSHPKAAGL